MITPTVLAAIHGALPPLAPDINIPVVVAIFGGLLIADSLRSCSASTSIAGPFAYIMSCVIFSATKLRLRGSSLTTSERSTIAASQG